MRQPPGQRFPPSRAQNEHHSETRLRPSRGTSPPGAPYQNASRLDLGRDTTGWPRRLRPLPRAQKDTTGSEAPEGATVGSRALGCCRLYAYFESQAVMVASEIAAATSASARVCCGPARLEFTTYCCASCIQRYAGAPASQK